MSTHKNGSLAVDSQSSSSPADNTPAKSTATGLDHLRLSRLNKGLAFSLTERQALGIHGLMPPTFKSIEDQLAHCRVVFDFHQDELSKYMYLLNLLEQNERLFFRFFAENMVKVMPIVYTPTVGLACQKFGLVYSKPRGLFITIHDKGHVYEVLSNWPETDVRAIVVTDGERILGLGDLGANGMGIPVGKLALYTALAGIKPHQLLPITLDVGTNTESLRNDPHLYVGLRHPRVTGPEYDDFIDEFMEAVVRRFGPTCLIQFEDFGNSNAFKLLAKYRDSYCTFNDDIQGTASVALAGVLASLKVTNTRLSDNTILFQGAGEANLGIAGLCLMAMQEEGTSLAEARQRIWLVDSKGLIVKNRPEGGVTGHKVNFAQDHPPIKSLEDVVAAVKPTILIGAAAVGGAFTPKILELMADFNERPVIFALSNPTSKAECTAEEAYLHTKGKCLFASGSPFNPVTYGGKTYHPGQGNNAYIFPGVALAVIAAGIKRVKEEVFLLSAQALAEMVTEKDLARGTLYPPLESIRDCSLFIAKRVVKSAYDTGLATVFPEPADMESYIKAWQYKIDYSEPSLSSVYKWPHEAVQP